jgi:hypothetical protein
MSDTVERSYKIAKDALDLLFSDRSVSPQTTRAKLETLYDQIGTYLDALDSDIARIGASDDDDDEDDWLPEDEWDPEELD